MRSLEVAPNGHAHARKRRLRDSGVRFVLETCSTLFNYAQRHRHLPPYAENPFRAIEVSRIPIEDAKPIRVFSEEQERRFLEACDAWQFPIFLTLFLTGLRPGELVHLLLPDDLDLEAGWLYVRNKPALGWRVKTRHEREIPLVPALAEVLRQAVKDCRTGPAFQQRRCFEGYTPPLAHRSLRELEAELTHRAGRLAASLPNTPHRSIQEAAAKTVWRDLAAIKEDWVRKEFMQLTTKIGLPEITAPKTLRHTFATCLQDDFLVPGAADARCIDAARLEELSGKPIMAEMKGGRKECGCFASRDIGEYDTCPHGCVYCYAVLRRRLAQRRYHEHDPQSEFLFPTGITEEPNKDKSPQQRKLFNTDTE